MPNPLLNPGQIPTFSDVIPSEHVKSALVAIIDDYKNKLNELLEQTEFTWDNLFAPLNDIEDRMDNVINPFALRVVVMRTDELTQIEEECSQLQSTFATETMQNLRFYHAVKSISQRADFATLDPAKRKEIEITLRNFELSGVHLSAEIKEELLAISKRMAELTSKFDKNDQAAADAWFYHTTDEHELKGLPETDLKSAAAEAKKRDKEGWVLTLKMPVMMAVLKNLDNRYLRKLYFNAFYTRASDIGPHAGQWDNMPVIEEILSLRHRKAQLLGFKNYADFAAVRRMAKTGDKVASFLDEMVSKMAPAAKVELAELRAFAEQDGVTDLQPWDVGYYSEKLRLHKYNFSQEMLKPYFPLSKVLPGYFTILNSLYGITVRESKPVDAWHEDVRQFDVYDESGVFLGSVLADIYARAGKRDGAFMESCRTRLTHADGTTQYPIAFLVTNFSKPTDDAPTLLKEDNLKSLFHEFGHCLHHIFTKVNVKSVSGISGVPLDGIEFPSQFMENFIYKPQTIKLISGHYQTGETLPDEIFQRMVAAKNFQVAMFEARQLHFSAFDFRLHQEYDPARGARIKELWDEVQKQVAPLQWETDSHRFYCQFKHIFSGGYPAGYYSYRWSVILSYDAFARFDEDGVLSRKVGDLYRREILEVGGVPDFLQAFINFRGREPSIEAMLRSLGMEEKPQVSEAVTALQTMMQQVGASVHSMFTRGMKRKLEQEAKVEVMEDVPASGLGMK